MFDALLASEPDVVALQELTPAHATVLRGHPLRAALGHCLLEPAEGGFGIGLCTREPLTEPRLRDWEGVPAASGRVRGVTVVAVHAFPPVRANLVSRRGRQLASLAQLRDGPTLVAGDLNTTPDEPAWRFVDQSGWTGATAACGLPRRPTWPVPLPVVRLDHVLLDDGMGCVAVDHVAVTGTDHAVVVADVTVPLPGRDTVGMAH